MKINWQWFVKLTPTNKLIVVLAAGAVFFVNAWLIDSRLTISTLRKVVQQGSAEKRELNEKLQHCEQESRAREQASAREQVEYERARAREKDSINLALYLAEKALKKR